MNCRKFDKSIEYTNDGGLSLFFLGTGSAFTKTNFQTNFLIIKENQHILVDCGTLCSLSFNQLNSKISDISTFIITHSHADHTGGIEEVALLGKYFSKKKLKIIISDEYKKELWNETLKGGCKSSGELSNRKKLCFDDYFQQLKPSKLKNYPRPFYDINIKNLNIKLFRTKHSFNTFDTWKTGMYSVGIIIDNRILFTGDSKYDPEIIEWINKKFNIEYIIHDCSLVKNSVHACYDELKQLPQSIKNKTFLCHYGDNYKSIDSKKDGFLGFIERAVYYDF